MTHTVDDSIIEMRLLLDDINDDPDEIHYFMIPKEWFWLIHDLDMDWPYSHSTMLPMDESEEK